MQICFPNKVNCFLRCHTRRVVFFLRTCYKKSNCLHIMATFSSVQQQESKVSSYKINWWLWVRENCQRLVKFVSYKDKSLRGRNRDVNVCFKIFYHSCKTAVKQQKRGYRSARFLDNSLLKWNEVMLLTPNNILKGYPSRMYISC